MRARQRHLNARDAGATMVLDARFLSGSDGDAIQTWTSRTSATYNMSQATSTKRPLLKLGANGINGQAAVLFDGSNDMMTGVNESFTSFTIIYTANQTNAAGLRVIFCHVDSSSTYRQYPIVHYGQATSGTNKAVARTSNGSTFLFAESTDATTGAHVVSNRFNQTTLYCGVDGKTEGTATPSYSAVTNNSWAIGANNEFNYANGIYFFDSNIGSIVVFKSTMIADPIRKRLIHAQAASFKIACS
jgi:hypothetical protein